ncbi:MAG: extracellular solute-binding protein [Erysipelotrichaceae bacterium]|nr:extracellular solute-binding protein [Erysipelotrichaceae bacterium]MBQ7888229.1 extracellular solute-binding protein [Erysipelotrichaceae bacterium]MBQ7890416.1 extracellular solute-binding protein [Erysipelotrichaceae bacterium]
MKKLFKLVLALMLVLGMAACGSSNGGTDTPADDEPKEVKFAIWHTFTKAQETMLQDFAAEYMAAHEGVTIDVVGGYDYSTFEGTVSDAVTNGVGPQLIFNYTSFAKNFDGYDMLLPLEEYWDFKLSDVTSANYVEEASAFDDGKVYAAPMQTTGPLLFVNKTIYDELGLSLPRTWDELKANSKKIYEEKNIVGFAVDSATDFAQMLILQTHDGQYVDLANKKVVWNDEALTQWVEWWAEGVREGYFQLKAQSADGYNSGDINSGILASYIGSSAGLPYLGGQGADATWELAVTTVPVIDENSVEVVNWNRSAIGFKTGDEATDAAIADFVAYLIEQNGRWVQILNAYSPYYKVQENADYQAFVANDLALTALGGQLVNGIVPPTFSGANQVRTELDTMMKGVLNEGWTAEAAVNTAATNAEAAMNE